MTEQEKAYVNKQVQALKSEVEWLKTRDVQLWALVQELSASPTIFAVSPLNYDRDYDRGHINGRQEAARLIRAILEGKTE